MTYKRRKGWSPIYKWIGLTLLTGFVLTGALPERTKAEPVIYPVRPLTEAFVPVQVPTSDGLVERIGRRVRIELYAAAREINGRTPESAGGGDLGTDGYADEDSLLSGEELQDVGADCEAPEDVSEPALTYLGAWTATAYCACPICCGEYSSGYTASGTLATAGRTVACNALPMGSRVLINGQEFIVEDTGWTPYGDAWVDIYFDSHDDALAFGVQTVDVYLIG